MALGWGCIGHGMAARTIQVEEYDESLFSFAAVPPAYLLSVKTGNRRWDFRRFVYLCLGLGLDRKQNGTLAESRSIRDLPMSIPEPILT
jgi:hypothetical protein